MWCIGLNERAEIVQGFRRCGSVGYRRSPVCHAAGPKGMSRGSAKADRKIIKERSRAGWSHGRWRAKGRENVTWLAGVDGCPDGFLVAFVRPVGPEVRL